MLRVIPILSLWVLSCATALADLSFIYNSQADVAVTSPGYTASGPLDLTLQFQPAPGQNLTVVKNTGPAFISGTFDGVGQGSVLPLAFNGVTYRYIANYHGGNGRSLVLQWPELQIVGWGGDSALQGSATTGYGASPSLLANEGGLAGKMVLATSPGSEHALVLTADGKVFAWGSNTYGQLGNGMPASSNIPVAVDASGALAGKTVVAIAAGSFHNLALTSDGLVFAWGENGSGRLGDGTTEMRRSPVPVLTSGALAGKTVVAIAAGQYHSLALTSDGRVFAWGYGFQGQLGNGTIDNQLTPGAVDTSGVLAGKTVTGISAGFYHSVAVTSDGRIAAWGFNTNGQLGNNSTSPSPVPVQVVATGSLAGKTVTDARAGANFNLALTSDGKVHAWGSNGSGQLGIGSTTDSLVPALTSGSLAGQTVVAIAAGNAHSAALTTGGQPHVWGSDGNGQLGNGVGPEVSALVPVPVPGLGPATGRRVASLFAGASRCHALTDPGPPRMRVHPLDLTANPGAVARFAAAVTHPFPISIRWQMSASGVGGPFQDITNEPSAATGTLMLGELGGILDGAAFRAVFSSVSGTATSNPATLHKTVWPATFSTAAGPLATVTAASVAGNLEPALGFEPTPGTDLTLIRNTGPAPIYGRFANIPHGATVSLTFNGVTYRYVANYHGGNGRSLVLQWPAMGLAGWGSNYSGVLGDIGDSSQNPPAGIPLAGPLSGKTITDVSMSGAHVLALTSDGLVFAWGDNSSGQLGNNSTTKSNLPVAVDTSGALAGKTVVAIAAGESHSFAITSEGRIVTWGKRRAGFGATVNSLTPVEFSSGGLLGKTVVAVSPGGTFDLALTSEGEIHGWGENSFGQLSGYSTGYRVDPVRVEAGAIGTRPVISIAAGKNHCLAIDLDGRVFSWGAAQYGALGINSGPTDFSVVYPVAVHTDGVLAGKTLSGIAAREAVSMAVATDGTVSGWGKNWSGELGNGTTTNSSVPVAVDASGVLAGKAVAEVRLGLYHCTALATTGELFSWGDNGNSQLGDGGWTDRLVPVAVTNTGVMKDRKTTRFATGWQSVIGLIGLGPPTVTRQPQDLMAAAGQTASFTAEAEDPFSFTVKWQVSPTGIAGPFSDIPGNSSTLTLPAITASQDGWAYRAVFTSDAGQSLTEPAVLRVVEWSATLTSASPAPFKSERVQASGTFNLQLGFAPAAGSNLTLIENSGPEFIHGVFDNIPQGGLVTLTYQGVNHPFIASYHGGNGRSLVLQWPWTSVAAWGLTYGTSPASVTTRPALAAKTITSLQAGSGHQLALTADGKAFGWGSNNYGQLGNTLTTSSQMPVAVKDDGVLAGKTLAAIATGTSHNLALTTTGELFSWGYNFDGRLGDGTSKVNRTQPVAVVADGALAGKTITAIAAGDSHSLALSADGRVFAWGSNTDDQLGTEAWQDSMVPLAVDTRGVLHGKLVMAIAAGARHSLALTSDGGVIAWGGNGEGQLGNGDTIDSRIPVKVVMTGALAGKRVVAIAAGENHSVALTADGLVFTWGGNGYGQLGSNAAPTSSPVPVAVASDGVLAGKSVISISAGTYQCVALTAGGAVVSWGLNSGGQLGNGGTVNSAVPVAVATNGVLAGATVNAILAGSNRSFAVLGVASGPFVTAVPQSRSFILGAAAGVVPASFTAVALDPLPVSIQWQVAGPAGDFSDIPGAAASTLPIEALTTAMDGRRYRAVFSNVGGSATSPHATLKVASAESPVIFQNSQLVPFTAESPVLAGSLNVSLGFAPVLGDDLTLVRNTGGSFFTGNFANLIQGAGIQLTHGGFSHSFVVDYFGDNGRSLVLRWASALPAAWGAGSSGQVGAGDNLATNRTPVAVGNISAMAGQTLVKLAAGTSHSLALAASGRIFAWGANGSGRLGDGTTTSSNLPVEVDATGELAGKRVVAIAAGNSHSLALTADGQLVSWGSNASGQLGNGGSSGGSPTPVAVARDGVLAGKTVIAIAAGQNHSVALLSDGTLVAWGANASGQLGTGNTTLSTRPVNVISDGALAGRTVVAIAAGSSHTLALTADGRVFSWGSNQSGQLGLGSSFPSGSNSPAAVSGSGLVAGKAAIAIAAGSLHCLALTTDGMVYAWGLGSQGQLGTGSTSNFYGPVDLDATGVLAGKSVAAISAGGSHSLAIDSNGSGYAWGGNGNGQLGNNSTSSTATRPVALSTLGAVGSRPLAAIAAGGSHSLAIAAKGTAPAVTQSPTSIIVTAGSSVTFTAAGDGYPSPTVRWQRSTTGPGGSFTDLAGQTTTTLQLATVTASQTAYAYRAVFINLEASTNSNAATLTVQPTFASFLVSKGLAANSPPLDDPFHTGIPHLLAYAFNLNPAAPDRSKLPAATMADGRLRISYTRWKHATDIRYSVEAADGLDTWRSGPGVTEIVAVLPLDNARETVVEQEILPESPPSRFLRVRVELAPP